MVSLICEGACNPSLPNFDAAAEVYAELMADGIRDEKVRDYLIRERQRLGYTLHGHRFGNRWACTVCGCERQYGPGRLSIDAGDAA